MSTTTLAEAINLFLGQQITSTRNSYWYVLKALQGYVGPARPLDQIDPADLLRYMQSVDKSPTITSPATYNKHVKTIRTFFNWCVKAGLLTKAPSSGLKRQRQHKQVPKDKAMPDHVYETLLDYARWDRRLHALILFLGDTGARIGGAAGLRWGDIDFAQRSAIVTEKGKEPRPVFFGEACARALLRWREQHTLRDGDYVFHLHGRRIQNNSLGKVVERAAAAAGLGQWGPHSLRHRLGHRLADQRVAPSLAQQALGHESVLTTLTSYYPQDWERVRAALDELAHKDQSKQDTRTIPFTRKLGNT